MLITVEADLFLSPATVLVNPVNTAGVMSSGVSAEFRRFFPGVFEEYRALCDAGKLTVGRVWLAQGGNKRILHMPIKAHWRSAAKREDLEAVVQLIASRWAQWGIGSLAIPQFDEDGLDWNDSIRPLLESALGPLPIPIYLHTYDRKADPSRSLRQLDTLLNQPTDRIDTARFWRDLARAVRKVDGAYTGWDGQPFSVELEANPRRRRLTITQDGRPPVVLTDSSLNDLFTTLQLAGLLMAWQFPAGLEPLAVYLIPILAGLGYVRPVKTVVTGEGGLLNALLFVPPPAAAAPHRLTLSPSEGA